MGFTSSYAQDQMNKTVKPKTKTKIKTKGSDTKTVTKTNSPIKKTKTVSVNGRVIKKKIVKKRTKTKSGREPKYTSDGLPIR